MPVPPIAEMRNVLGQPQMGEPLYAMERERPARMTAEGKHPLGTPKPAPREGRRVWAPQEEDEWPE